MDKREKGSKLEDQRGVWFLIVISSYLCHDTIVCSSMIAFTCNKCSPVRTLPRLFLWFIGNIYHANVKIEIFVYRYSVESRQEEVRELPLFTACSGQVTEVLGTK